MNVVVTGAGGMLARAVLSRLEVAGHHAVGLDREALDVTDGVAVEETVVGLGPDAVIQCAAYTEVDAAESEPDVALAVNGTGAALVARACARAGARFVYPSTDYVFNGLATAPYAPDDAPSPLGAYGRSKLAGESAAWEAGDWLIVRTAWLYGAGGPNFVATILARAREGAPLRVVDDQRGAPTWTVDLARALVSLTESAPSGIYHATNAGETTWFGLAREALRLEGLDVPVTPVCTDEFPRPAPRPRYSVLDCATTAAVVGPLRDWRAALRDAVDEGVL